MPPVHDQSIHVFLTEEQWDVLELESKRAGCPMADLIRTYALKEAKRNLDRMLDEDADPRSGE